MPSLLELSDLYTESLVREIIEKTKACALTWTSIGGTQFKATSVDTSVGPAVTWTFFVTKTLIGSTLAKYTLDIKKDSVTYISTEDGPLPHTGRDSIVKQLYEIVEILVLQLDLKLKEVMHFVQDIPDCRT